MNNNITPTNATNVTMVPDLLKTIDQFDGEKDGKGAANFWLRSRVAEITNLKKFVEAFQRTFVYEGSKTALWKRMQDRTQQMKENFSPYFHERVSLCKALDLAFSETKEQLITGLWSRELGSLLMSKAHQYEDELFKDFMSFERVNTVRKTRISDHREQGKKVSLRKQKAKKYAKQVEFRTGTFARSKLDAWQFLLTCGYKATNYPRLPRKRKCPSVLPLIGLPFAAKSS
ncbi:hypothetical protein Trydic_g13190 [Trypoxylus dichotomus]